MSRRSFLSDNAAGVHPRVLEALAAANSGHAPAYGDDRWTGDAVVAMRRAFDADAEVLFCFGGTGANVLALASVTRPHQAILCAASAHIWNDECAAPERFINAKLIPLPHTHGKLDCTTLAGCLRPTRGVHHALPRVISITQPTEWGVLYTPDEIRALAAFAHEHELLLHVDGARFCNAAAALGVSLAELAPRCGVDILSFGGTKNGLLGAEAVLFFDRSLAAEAAWARKQAMQLASKMRFLSAQFLAYLEDDLWRELATQANAMAARLAGACSAVPGLSLVAPVDCNMLFAKLPAGAIAPLQERFPFHLWDASASIVRWLTAFDTTPADVDAFAAAIAAACDPASAPR